MDFVIIDILIGMVLGVYLTLVGPDFSVWLIDKIKGYIKKWRMR